MTTWNLGDFHDSLDDCPGCGIDLTDRWLQYRADHRRGELVRQELRCPECGHDLLASEDQ